MVRNWIVTQILTKTSKSLARGARQPKNNRRDPGLLFHLIQLRVRSDLEPGNGCTGLSSLKVVRELTRPLQGWQTIPQFIVCSQRLLGWS